jgi:hypothetical protein
LYNETATTFNAPWNSTKASLLIINII